MNITEIFTQESNKTSEDDEYPSSSINQSNNKCNLCPHNCLINRSIEIGFCKAPNFLKINTYQLHYGEEPIISGLNGSGTIFFSHCNMKCCYCQNYLISSLGTGQKYTEDEFIDIILDLQDKGAHNINLVSPTPYTDLIIPALKRIKFKNLKIPIVWNSNAYESVETLKKLEGLVDIYLPDFKYWDNEKALKYSMIPNYKEYAQSALKEMYRQTGKLIIDNDVSYGPDGIAIVGTLIRILVLPENQNNIEEIIQWIYENLSNDTYISLMAQYYPTYKAINYPEINRPITQEEYDHAVHILEGLGFENVFIQELGTTPEWTPKFNSNMNL
ncbi:MAG: radical SAM protein [Candidatus Cloacimonetes bacterium]|nr:radical SAM protein [Candidatus Cloacimonadota bacterium]